MKNQFSAIRFVNTQKEYASRCLFVRLAVIRITVAALFLVISTFATKAQSRVYVDSSKSASGNGLSWGTAYKTLQEALDAQKANTNIWEIWVKKGTYYPTKYPDGCTNCTTRDYTFVVPSGITLSGGFAGTETDLSQRNVTANPTILSGNLGDLNFATDNSYHVMLAMDDAYNPANIDGLTIKDGYFDTRGFDFYMLLPGKSIERDFGAGLYCYKISLGVTNCVVDNNIGFSSVVSRDANPYIERCVFANNSVGPAIYNTANSTVGLFSSLFYNNGTFNQQAGAIQQTQNSTAFINSCTFYKNASNNSGAVVYNNNSWSEIQNSILYRNDGGGGMVVNTNGGTATVAYSLVQGGYAGDGNINSEPEFVKEANPAGPDNIFRTADDGLKLIYGSPAMNTGEIGNRAIPTDLTDAPRVQGGVPDRGAYEGAACPSYNIIYVDSSIANPGGGDSWATAVNSLSKAIGIAATCGGNMQLWIKKGTYYPSEYPVGCTNCTSSRDYSFSLKSNMAVYGGFAGTETSLTQRDPVNNITILSGNIGNTSINTDNCHHVVEILGLNNTCTLDGFTIQDGRADGSSNVTVTPYQLLRNAGAGLYLIDASPTITRCIFKGNTANQAGGMFVETGVPSITNCVFTGNQAIANFSNGGGLYASASTFTVANTLFVGNSVPNRGGAAYTFGSNLTFVNNTFYGNSSPSAGPVDDGAGNSTFVNCILWQNTGGGLSSGTVSYSVIEGGNEGTNNLSANPRFRNAADPDGADNLWGTADDGLRPIYGSTSINSGNNAVVNTATDLIGGTRIQATTVDRGAYEGGTCYTGSRLYVDASVANTGVGDSWGSALKTLQEAISIASACSNITEIWVKKGTYYPSQYPDGCTNCGTRDYTFQLKNNMAIYGGFSGTETSINDRNLAANPSVLSGNIGNAADNTDNCHHVVMSVGCNGTAILDGFTVLGGQAAFLPSNIYMNLPSLTVPRDVGSGLYNYQSSPTVSSCIFSTCYSYATIYNENAASPTFSNTVFANNSLGAAFYNKTNSSPSLTNCVITGNGAPAGNSTGGISNNGNCNPIIKSTTFYGNNYQDGLIYSNNSSPVISGSILWGKSANANMIVNNGGTATVSYSIVEGGFTGTGNVNSSPLFVNASDPDGTDNIFATADDGLMIARTSAALDADKSGSTPQSDILWTARPTGLGADMGAYELNYPPVVASVTITSQATNICATTSITFSASLVNGGATPAYQWKKNGTPIVNATQPTYTAGRTDITDGDQITVALTSSLYASPNPVTSNTITIQTPSILYVDASVIASGDGASWATAFKTLAEAINVAHACPLVEKLLIAKGTYTPMSLPYNMGANKSGVLVVSADNRDKTFHIRAGLELYGGYPNGGGTRNITANATILDGANVGGVVGDYAYHVVLVDTIGNWGGINDTTKLSGLIIKNGKADGSGTLSVNNYDVERNRGGGVYVAKALNFINNNVLIGNNASVGAGLYSYYGHDNFYNNVFVNNTAAGGGGGCYTLYGVTNIANNIATGNTAEKGGGFMIDNGVNVLTNNTFYNNAVTFSGGGLHCENGIGTYTNNVFWGNKKGGSENVPAADYYKNPIASNLFKNCVLQFPSSSYTISGGTGNYDLGIAATGNIFATNPFFANPATPAGADGLYGTADDGLRLAACSPAINKGNNGAVTNIASDIVSNARIFENTVDIGAYELTATQASLLPDVNIAGDASFCPGSTNILTATAGFSSYLWSNGATVQSINGNTPGKYIVTATDATGCIAKDSITISHKPASDLSLTNFQLNGAIAYTQNSYWLDYYSNRATSIWYRDSIDLNYDFELSFNISLGTSPSADGGMAFVLQKAGIYAVGRTPGASLGYYDSKATFNQSVAIEMDMTASGEGAPWYDPDYPHVAFVKNGSAQPVAGPFALDLSVPQALFKFTWNHLTNELSIYRNGVLMGKLAEDLTNTVFGGRSKVIFGFTSASKTVETIQVVDIVSAYPYIYDRQLEIKQDCGSNTLSSNAANGSAFLWSTGATSGSIQALPGNTYTVTTSYGGCSFTASKYVATITNPAITANGPLTGICPGTPVILTASAGQRFAWTNDSATQNITVTAPGNYSVFVDGCKSADVTIVNAASGGLAINGDQASATVSGATLLAATNCRAVGYVQPNGNQPVGGVINAQVWVEPAIPYYQKVPYVARHFNVKPVVNAAGATSSITLYFSQQDFNLFNAENVNNPVYSLPASDNDAVGKNNLRVFQLHGDGDATGLPGSYTGDMLMINPADDDILWNAAQQRWEVSFNITGFSGFFVGVDPSTVLPVHDISLTGRLSTSQQTAYLNWQVSGQKNVAKYIVERAVGSNSFISVGSVAANGIENTSYSYTDAVLPTGTFVWYRLKAVDIDGKTAYSNIISFTLGKQGQLQLYPNPASQQVFLNSSNNSLLGTEALLSDAWGRVLQKIKITAWPQKINTSALATGFYFIKTADEHTLRIVIER